MMDLKTIQNVRHTLLSHKWNGVVTNAIFTTVLSDKMQQQCVVEQVDDRALVLTHLQQEGGEDLSVNIKARA